MHLNIANAAVWQLWWTITISFISLISLNVSIVIYKKKRIVDMHICGRHVQRLQFFFLQHRLLFTQTAYLWCTYSNFIVIFSTTKKKEQINTNISSRPAFTFPFSKCIHFFYFFVVICWALIWNVLNTWTCDVID